MTGRGAGYCAGYGMPGFANVGGGRGRGRGQGIGRGMGWGRGFGAVPFAPAPGRMPNADIERWNLERQAEYLEEKLKAIRGRLDALGTASGAAEDIK